MKTFTDFISEENVSEGLDMKSILKIKTERLFDEIYSKYPELRKSIRKGTKEQILDRVRQSIKINNISKKDFEQIVMDVHSNWGKKKFK